MDRILVVDFGGQYAHLIANRIRRIGVLADIASEEDSDEQLSSGHVKGIILSGGPLSVYDQGAPQLPQAVLNAQLPILGICYGEQLLAHALGGIVSPGRVKEYGKATVNLHVESPLFFGITTSQIVWMSHGDSVTTTPPGFHSIASTIDCPIAGIQDENKRIFGIQFHPEVTHTSCGMRILENFVLRICECTKSWNTKLQLEEITRGLSSIPASTKVFVLVSGGVDSLVLFTLLNKTIGPDRVLGLHVDTGLLREGESKEVLEAIHNLGYQNLRVADESTRFLGALEGKFDPEEKRHIIGDLFISVLDDQSSELLKSGAWLVAQGTIYPDTIESKGTAHADLIKTHHNRVPAMQQLIAAGKVIEPLSHLYKDEVRSLGMSLGLPRHLVDRHPFPGPGLGIRILCTSSFPDSKIIHEIESKTALICKDSFILPIRSVGVQGDGRTYRHAAAVQGLLSWDELDEISTRMTNHIGEINRVLLLITQKQGTLRGVPHLFTEKRVVLLRQVDAIVTTWLRKHQLYDQVWQMPVVLIPLAVKDGESVILRPVESQEAMTASFARLPRNLVDELAQQIMGVPGIDAVFYDVTNKPPGTIEWE